MSSRSRGGVAALTVAGFALVAAGPATTGASAVVGGTAAPVSGLPWIVQIGTTGAEDSAVEQFCTGTLIRPRVVLTAAHCVLGFQVPRYVVVGRQSTDGRDGRRFRVRRVTYDQTFVETFTRYGQSQKRRRGLVSDVALLELRRPVTGVAPVALGGAADAPLLFPGSRPYLAGWGLQAELPDDADEIPVRGLHAVAVPARSAAWCVANLAAEDGSSRGVACVGRLKAGNPPTGACNGDSGGPLFGITPAGPVQLGVLSQVSLRGCDAGRTYAVKVLPGIARKWIENHITAGGRIREALPVD